MKTFGKILAGAVLAGALAFGGALVAQTILIPQVVNVGTKDLFQDVVGGAPTAPASYATAAAIAGVPGYVQSTPLTGFSLTFGNTQKNMTLTPAGTLATGTITMAPNPGDGQEACMFSTQTQTALTLSANTGQTVANAITAMTALTRYCYQWSAAAATWYRVQ